jgi:hypothetical protein
MKVPPRHQCLIYHGSPARYLASLANVIKAQLGSNSRCLFMNSPAMVAGMRSYLAAAGLDVAQEVESGALVLSSDQSHLKNGQFEIDRMIDLLTEAVEAALRDGYASLWATGDMTWEFGNESDFGKLMEYECALEELFRRYPPLHGICQYHADTLPARATEVGLCSHSAIFINDTLARVNPHYLPAASRFKQESATNAAQMREILDRLSQPEVS